MKETPNCQTSWSIDFDSSGNACIIFLQRTPEGLFLLSPEVKPSEGGFMLSYNGCSVFLGEGWTMRNGSFHYRITNVAKLDPFADFSPIKGALYFHNTRPLTPWFPYSMKDTMLSLSLVLLLLSLINILIPAALWQICYIGMGLVLIILTAVNFFQDSKK